MCSIIDYIYNSIIYQFFNNLTAEAVMLFILEISNGLNKENCYNTGMGSIKNKISYKVLQCSKKILGTYQLDKQILIT